MNSTSHLEASLKTLMAARPRSNNAIYTVAKELLEQDPGHFLANIEMAHVLSERGAFDESFPYATKALKINPRNSRVRTLVCRASRELGMHFVAIEHLAWLFGFREDVGRIVLAAQSEEDAAITAIIKILDRLADNPVAWDDKRPLIPLLRDLLIDVSSRIRAKDFARAAIARIKLTPALGLQKTIRLLQLKSCALGSNDELSDWYESVMPVLSAEEDFVAFQLIGQLGQFPLQFKAFTDGQDTIARKALDSCLLKLGRLAGRFGLAARAANEPATYLFVLAHIPQAEWFLRLGSHFKAIADYCFFLTKVDPACRVRVLITNEVSDKASHSLYARWGYCGDSAIFHRGLGFHHPGFDSERIEFRVVSQTPGADNSDYFSQALTEIATIRPTVIVWFGGVLESVVLPHIVNKYFPSVYRQFNIGNRPRCEFDVGLTHSAEIVKRNQSEHWIKFEATFSDLAETESLPADLRSWLEGRRVIVTAGSDLARRVDEQFVLRMMELLDNNTDIRWLLVGLRNIETFLDRFARLRDCVDRSQVRCMPFVGYLGSILDHSDVFAYPKNSGGGGGMALAAMRGIPVMCFAGRDADALFAREDMVDNYDDYFSKLRLIIADTDERKRLGLKYKEAFGGKRYLEETAKFVQVCRLAGERFIKKRSGMMSNAVGR